MDNDMIVTDNELADSDSVPTDIDDTLSATDKEMIVIDEALPTGDDQPDSVEDL